MWPCRWSTATSGSRLAHAIALAAETPTRSAPIRPGPARHRDRVDRVTVERGFDDRSDQLEVTPARNLGHDTAEARVQLGL